MVNEAKEAKNEGCAVKEEREAGLSRTVEHRTKRRECITKFHGIRGRMPLSYNYRKVAVGEQGICKKDGKMVFCDQ